MPETKSEAVRRFRLQAEISKNHSQIVTPGSVPLGDRAHVFGDAVRTVLRHSPKEPLDLMSHSTWVCRALKGYSLPSTAGFLVRPILLCQPIISDEISQAALSFHHGEWNTSSQWHSAWIPMYDASRPEPLWRRPREPD